MADVIICMTDFWGVKAEIVEVHKGKSHADVHEILKQWTEKGDRIVKQDSADTKRSTITPYTIMTADGEMADIFAQVYEPLPAHLVATA